jgi:ribosomal-protein-alanine N-acetyltransferase
MIADELAALHAKCFIHPRPWTRAEFSDLLNSPAVFLCTQKHGFALGRIAGPEVELLTIAVDPDFRQQGIAQKLMEQFAVKAKSAEEMFLEVAQSNLPAIKLYERAGFKKIGERKGYYSDTSGARITALIMGKSL